MVAEMVQVLYLHQILCISYNMNIIIVEMVETFNV